MDRRQFLHAAGVTSTFGLAGCVGVLGSDDGPEPEPDGERYEFADDEDAVTDSFTLEEGLVAVDFHNFGVRHVSVHLRPVDESVGELLVNEIGAFDGTAATHADGGEYELVVDGDQWEATVRQPRFSEAEYESVPYEVTGRDYAVLGPFDFDRDAEVAIELDSEELVIVNLLSVDGVDAGRVFSASDDEGYQGSGTVGQAGGGLLFVETTGTWTLTVDPA